MKNPVDEFSAFIDSIAEEEQGDFLLHLLAYDIGERSTSYWGEEGQFRKGFHEHFLDKKNNPIGFTGLCLKIRVFTDDYFGRFSEESEKEQMDFFKFVRDSERPTPENIDKMENNAKSRAVYYRSILPDWEKLKAEFFSKKYIKDFNDKLFFENSPLKE
ncbi:hypothetical protein [Hoeflea sp. EC-HK425]|uniref:hypothetical protein n=1 Tax=Hoeflea sp. EC-HK425 TaxID=2038388 RepID=UPI0012578D4E|nr:hypothetical protein [Hoeflea sp. EC-HK425]VVS99798.1 hypothetical protein HOE425_280003 [Hoeflea sp. EC-HK425]